MMAIFLIPQSYQRCWPRRAGIHAREVYRDEASQEAHRAMPRYDVWRAAADTLDGPAELTRCQTVFPAAGAYWDKD